MKSAELKEISDYKQTQIIFHLGIVIKVLAIVMQLL